MDDAPMPDELAGSVLGSRMAFLIDALRGARSSDAELAAHYAHEPPHPSLSVRRSALQHFAAAIGAFRVTGYEQIAPVFLVALAEDHRGRRWRVSALVDSDPPHRLRFASAFLIPPPDVNLRPARPADAAGLRSLERDCPVIAGAVRTWYDHGDDYHAGERLMGSTDPLVVERDGKVIAIHSTVVHPLRIGGRIWQASYLHRTRIHPEAQRGGLFGMLNGASFERRLLEAEIAHSYVAEGNEASLKLIPFPPWKTRAERLIVDTRAQRGAPAGRAAMPDDAVRIAKILNRAHEAKELFVPYTPASLSERLAREQSHYGWSSLLVSSRAAVGVWDARLGVTREDEHGRSEAVRGLVLDWGAEPGAEDQLVLLLRAWCARLADGGTTELSLFTSEGDPARPALLPLATRIDRYHACLALPEPADLGARGLYVDHLYF